MDKFYEVCEDSSALATGGRKGTTNFSHALTLRGDCTEHQGTRNMPLSPFLQSLLVTLSPNALTDPTYLWT